MKRMSLVVMGLMVYASLSFGQLTFLPNDISKTKSHLPDKIREIRQYDGDKLLNVRYYDELKNMVFSHYKQYVSERWNGNYLTMIDAYSYDEKGRIEKMYVLHLFFQFYFVVLIRNFCKCAFSYNFELCFMAIFSNEDRFFRLNRFMRKFFCCVFLL